MDSAAKAIMADLQKKKFAPVYFLQGEETYYIDWIAHYIEEHALSPADRSFNQVILYGKDIAMPNLLTNARRFPMMAERQVVIVREAQDMADLQKEAGAKLLLDYLKAPVPSTVLVFCFKHKSLDKRKELGKKIDQLAVSATFKKPYENQLPEFIYNYVTEKGFRMEDAAIRALAEYVGNDLNRIVNEIDKVLIGSTPQTPIALNDVIAKVGLSREYNIFELQKAIVSRDRFTAQKIVNYFEANPKKNPAIPMVAFLYSFFSKLLIAASLPDKSEKSLVSNLKISPFAAREYSNALRSFSVQQLVAIIRLVKRADLQLKGVDAANQSEGQIVKELVVQILA
jgi:DNA polymerase-3 subunit delta